MKIAKLIIKNFRCFGDDRWVWIPKTDLNLIIGPNGSGKTALIDAIDIVLNSESRSNRALISEYDFPFCDTDKMIEIEIILTELGTDFSKFDSAIEFYDEKTNELTTELDDEDESGKKAIRIRFEAYLNQDEGEIDRRWILPKFQETEYDDAKELEKKQHESIGYCRINPAISAGAFTLNQYSALGRQLRKLKYRLGKLPDNLKLDYKLPICNFQNKSLCDECEHKEKCKPNPEESTEEKTIGEYFGKIISDAESMLGEDSWKNMKSGLGPRYGGLKSSLAAITLGLSPQISEKQSFIPFEKLSAGEKYALSFALAITQIPNASLPIVVMEEPETALYPGAISQMMSKIQSLSSHKIPQVIISSHAEAVVRCFAIEHIFVMGSDKKINALDKCLATGIKRINFEYLIMPGRTSALFAEKIIITEGAMDAIVSGELDRLAGIISSSGTKMESFAEKKWCFFDAGAATNVKDKADALKQLDKKIVLLFDGDSTGKKLAEGTKNDYPTFIYKHSTETEPILELALLYGLDEVNQTNAIRNFHSFIQCESCSAYQSRINNCLNKNGCPLPKSISKSELKANLAYSCLNEYKAIKTFPPAFKLLLEKIDSAQKGTVIELEIEKVS